MRFFSEHGPDNLADVVGFGHSIIMYGGEAVLEEVAALADSPVDACLVGVFGCAGLLQEADEGLRNVNVERARKHVDLLLRRDGFQSGDDGNVDAGVPTEFDKAEEAVVVEEHLGDDVVGSGLHLLLEVMYVALQVGGLEVLLGIGCHADAEVGGKSVLHRRVEVLAAIQVADHADEFRAVGEAVGFGCEVLLAGQSVAAKSHDVIDAQEVEVQQFALDVARRGAAADDVRHDFQLGVAAHDGCHDGHRAGSLGQRHAGVGAVAVGDVFHFVAVAGDVDEGRLELHQRVEALIEAACVAALQGRNEFEAGEGTLAAAEDVDDFHVNAVVMTL